MGKVDINKKQKKNALLQTAFDLFRDKGFAKTTISDIVSDAGLAKGTFYLYFKDKYDLRDKLIAHKAGQLFADAHHALLDQKFNSFEDQIIAVADYIIGRLNVDHGLLTFISKNLSWGIFKTAFENKISLGDDVNRRMMRDFRLYMLVGGMPQAVNEHIETNNFSKVDQMKRSI